MFAGNVSRILPGIRDTFKSPKGRAGHVRRTGHMPAILGADYQEVLEGAGREEAEDLLFEIAAGLDD